MRNITVKTYNSNLIIFVEEITINIDSDMCVGCDYETNIKEILEDVIDTQLTSAGQKALTETEKEKIENLISISIDAWSN